MVITIDRPVSVTGPFLHTTRGGGEYFLTLKGSQLHLFSKLPGFFIKILLIVVLLVIAALCGADVMPPDLF